MVLKKIIANENEYVKVLDIWQKSVRATHDFLKPQDLENLKTEMSGYLGHVDLYLWYDDGELVGFSGTNGDSLEMLFIYPYYTHRGYGTKIMQSLIKTHHIQSVDVNKDNEKAQSFYYKNGFIKFDESEQDGQDRAYPILHLK